MCPPIPVHEHGEGYLKRLPHRGIRIFEYSAGGAHGHANAHKVFEVKELAHNALAGIRRQGGGTCMCECVCVVCVGVCMCARARTRAIRAFVGVSACMPHAIHACMCAVFFAKRYTVTLLHVLRGGDLGTMHSEQ